VKIVFTFAPPHGDHSPSPIAREALDRFAPSAEIYELNADPVAYYTLFSQLWSDGEGWLNVEQDIELHDTVIAETEACPELWCVWPYAAAGNGPISESYLTGSLGCTKFSTELIAAHPAFIAALNGRSWQQLDSHILPGLQGLGYTQHVHWPAVKHHHLRQYGMTKRCDCRGDHP
jgi:hypothetical protein